MKMISVFTIFLSISAWATDFSHRVEIFCASPGNSIIQYCGVNFQVSHVQLLTQTSGSSGECEPDIDYGYSGTAVWVSSGCQGHFVVTGEDLWQ